MYSTRYSCKIVMKIEVSQLTFEKYSNIKFHENPTSGRRVVSFGQTDMTRLLVTFRNFANAPKTRRITGAYSEVLLGSTALLWTSNSNY